MSAIFSTTLLDMDASSCLCQVSEANLQEIAALAERYCELIDRSMEQDDRWLEEIARLLPRLHAAMTSLMLEGQAFAHCNQVDLDARFDLFSRLHHLLDDRDGYWMEFDLTGDACDCMSGSLADDLTDIYYELKGGLGAYENDPEHALALWCAGFCSHWASHLVDAERHLTTLAASGRLRLTTQ